MLHIRRRKHGTPGIAARVAVAVAAVALLGACGGDDGDDAATATTAGGSATTEAAAGAFPVTVDTLFGPVTIEEEPQRVVALGWSDAETALALGVQPVGAADWLAFGGEGVGPWAEGLYDEAPTTLATDWNYEAIAALQPDLILNTVSDGEEGTHELLSAIAPTVGIPAGGTAWGTPWRDQAGIIAAALGRPSEGADLIAAVEEDFAAAKAAHPELVGRSVAVGAYFDGTYGAYVDPDGRVRFVEELGLVNDPDIEALSTGSFYINLSDEQLGLLDADLTVVLPLVADDAATISADPLLANVPSARAGRLVVIDDGDLVLALSASNVLSLRYAIEHAVPLFADALAQSR